MSFSSFTVPPFSLVAAGLAIILLYLRNRRFAASSRGKPLPPGPRPLPIVGNMFDIPNKDLPWRVYAKMSKKYGNLLHFDVVGQPTVVINDYQTAIQLLEKRSAIYSSRPPSNMTRLTGWDWNIAFLAYGESWRVHRRGLWQHFQPNVIHRYHASQQVGAHMFLASLLDAPEKFEDNIKRTLGATLLKATYGLDIHDIVDIYMPLMEKATSSGDFLLAGASILEYFPFLAHIPTWVPGTGFLQIERLAEIHESVDVIRRVPWDDAKKKLAQTNDSDSITSVMLAELAELDHNADSSKRQEDIAKNITGTIYATATDTSSTTVQGFFVAMALNEDVQRKAQEELDRVVGPNRLPDLSDRESLPYIEALIKETLRWHVSLPLGITHYTTADDEYEGYFIPKNSIVMYNTWAMLHDPETYPEPEEFMPERFLKEGKLDPNVRDPATAAFGFGRRICPGRHFADVALYLYIASTLHTMNISLPVDQHGNPIKYELKEPTTIVPHFEDFECIIKPRSERAAELIRASVSELG